MSKLDPEIVNEVMSFLPDALASVLRGDHELPLVVYRLADKPEVKRRLLGALHALAGDSMSYIERENSGGFGFLGDHIVNIR